MAGIDDVADLLAEADQLGGPTKSGGISDVQDLLAEADQLGAPDQSGPKQPQFGPMSPRRSLLGEIGHAFAEEARATPAAIGDFLRKAGEAATLGFGAEISAGVESTVGRALGLSDRTFQEARDATRDELDRIGRERPVSSLAAGLLGGAATSVAGPLAVARGASLGTAAAKTGVAGGLSGFGHSRADTAMGRLEDAAVGAVVGAGLGAGGQKLFGEPAAKRDAARIIKEVTRGATASSTEAVSAAEDSVVAAVREFGLRGTGRGLKDPAKLLPRVQAAMQETGPRVGGDVLEATDETLARRVQMSDVLQVIERVKARRVKSAASKGIGRALDSLADDLIEAHGDEMSTRSLWRLKSDLASQGFENTPINNPSRRKKLQRELSDGVNKILNERVKLAGKLARERGDDVTVRLVEEREAALPLHTGLARIEGALVKGKRLARQGKPSKTPFSAENAINIVKNPLTAAAGAAGVNFLSAEAAGAILAGRAALSGLSLSDRVMTRLAREAAKGSRGAKLVDFALSIGLPRAAAVKAADLLAE